MIMLLNYFVPNSFSPLHVYFSERMKRRGNEFKRRSQRKNLLKKSLLNYIFITMASPMYSGWYDNLHIGGKAVGYFGNLWPDMCFQIREK